MIYYLYNPLSKGGKGEFVSRKQAKKHERKGEKTECFSLLDIREDISVFLKRLTAEDTVVICGGDGTLHQIINSVNMEEIPCKLYFYKAGSGNDYARGHKGNPFEISKEIKDLPYFNVNGEERKFRFMNGVGIGIDADICYSVNLHNKEESYLKTTIKALKNYKPFSLDLKLDGKDPVHYDDVYFVIAMNGKYIGGGMKIAPHAVRGDDHLDVYVITSKSKSALLRILILVYLGIHEKFKKIVHFSCAKEVEIKCSEDKKLQSDGEDMENIKTLYVNRDKH